MNTNIAVAKKQQVSVVYEINNNVEKINRNTELVGINMNSVREAGEMLFKVSESLNQVVRDLKAS